VPLLLALLLLLAGCAGVAEVSRPATQQDVLQLRSDLTALQREAQRAKSDADALSGQLDRRWREQATESERQTAALSRRLEGLASTLTVLAGRMDEISGRLDALTRQVKSIPPARSAAPAPSASSTPPPGATPPAAGRPTTGPLQPRDIYQAAYIDFSKGGYVLATAGFREFLRRFPDHELADDAQYWIGEAYFSLARGYDNASQPDKATQALEQAVLEFKKVVANYPRGDKTPTALYKEALALLELKQPDLAQARLRYLIENFPQAAETPLARERLVSLKER
jgi:tol-pal system protein YbgF